MKLRKSKVKVEHHTLEGFWEEIKKISSWPCVSSIIPGRIFRKNKGRGSRGLYLKYETNTGFKLLYKVGSSVQEVFVVCKDKEEFLRRWQLLESRDS